MLYALARPLLFALDPESAHSLTLRLAAAARAAGLLGLVAPASPRLPVRAMGLEFPNPVGAAAGIDKHAQHVETLAALGFGFLELGGVTPLPQAGNPRPRLFRISAARAIINRFGLNSVGVEAFVENLKRARVHCPIGVNVGRNRDSAGERITEDYERCLEALYPHVDYVSVNVSSPNTRGMRDLQGEALLEALLTRLRTRREGLRERHGRHVALAVKIAPDLEDAAIRSIAEVARRARVDGIVATNTTVSRQGVAGLPHGAEEGGLSGAPLTARAQHVAEVLCAALGGEIPVIGCGGIMSGAHAAQRVRAGAVLVQIYSGLVFRGPQLITECVRAIADARRAAS